MMVEPSNKNVGQPLPYSVLVMQKALSRAEQPFFMGLPNGKIIYANQAFIDMMGYLSELIDELSWDNDITLMSSNQDEEISIKKLIQTGEEQQYKKFLVKKNGVVFEVQINVYSMTEPDYEPKIIAFFINDTIRISDIPINEEIAEIQPIDYEYLLNNINEIFYTYGLDGRITYANKKSIDILGFNPEEAIGIPLWEFVPPRYRDSFIAELNKRFTSGRTGSYLATVIHRDGSEKVFNLKVSPIIKQGKIVGEMILAEDVTESRRIDKELRESNKKLNRMSQELIAANNQLLAIQEELRFQLEESEKNKDALANAHQQLEIFFDFLPDPTYIINPEGQVIMWNRAMEKLTGIKTRDILGKGNYEYAVPFFGCRSAMLIDQARPGDQNNEHIIVKQKEGQNTFFAEFYSAQLGKKGTYLASKSSSLYNKRGELLGYIETLRDISARKEAENALFESEKRYRTIIERIEDGYFEVDLSGNFIFSNKFLNEKLGYQAEEFLKLNFRDVMDEKNQKMVKTTFNRVYLTGKPVRDFEWLVKGRNEREMYVESTILPIYSEGEITAFRGLVRDISDRKKAEAALQRSERNLSQQVNYLNTLIHNLNEMFFTYDLEGKIAFVNKRSYDVVGYYPEEMLGKHITDFVPAEFRNRVRAGIAQRLGQGIDASYNLPVIHKDGSGRIIKMNTSPIRDTQGHIIGGMVLAEDVTERIRAEQALAISEAQYRAIVEDQTELIYRSLADNTLTFVNAAYCRYFGMSREDILEKDIHPEVYWEDRDKVNSSLRTLSEDKPVCSLEYRIVMPDGSLRWHQWTHRAIYNRTGEIVDYQSVGRDINESKLAEEKLTFLSHHDVLTGLYNRLYFEQAMQKWETNNNSVGLIMCDVDGLKLVNDTLGHKQGDHLLQVVARVIKSCFREEDIVARVGGDEFAVIIPRGNQKRMEIATSLIRKAINEYNSENDDFPISVSVGYAWREDFNISMAAVYRDADNNMYRDKLNKDKYNHSSMVLTLMKSMENRGLLSEGHFEYMQYLVDSFAKKLELPARMHTGLFLLAQFHDIGMIGVPEEIVCKPSSLTTEEYEVVKKHSEIGHRISLSAPDLQPISDWILKHHEHWNGGGYPLGLKEEEIPLECRILAIIDAYNAMTSDRPYRNALTQEQAIEELRKYSGIQFEPYLTEKFIDMIVNDFPDSESDQ